jgi:hypothetical protein
MTDYMMAMHNEEQARLMAAQALLDNTDIKYDRVLKWLLCVEELDAIMDSYIDEIEGNLPNA